MTNIKAEIEQILKREGVREFQLYKTVIDDELTWTATEESGKYENMINAIDAAYVSLLESLVLELGEVVEMLQNIKCEGHSDCCDAMKAYRPNYKCHVEYADEALARLTAKINSMRVE